MASEKITNLVEEVKGLSVLELSELVKAIEEEFGVTAAAPVVVAGGTIYGFVLFAVFLGAVLTGWGCQKEE